MAAQQIAGWQDVQLGEHRQPAYILPQCQMFKNSYTVAGPIICAVERHNLPRPESGLRGSSRLGKEVTAKAW